MTSSCELLGGFFLLGISLTHHFFTARVTIVVFLLLDTWLLTERASFAWAAVYVVPEIEFLFVLLVFTGNNMALASNCQSYLVLIGQELKKKTGTPKLTFAWLKALNHLVKTKTSPT